MSNWMTNRYHVLVKSEFPTVFSKVIPDKDVCDYYKTADFGLQMNGSVRESLENIPKIIQVFLSKYHSGKEEIIRRNFDKCIQSPDCQLKIVLDKKDTNSMTLCVVVDEVEICFYSTCTCPTNRSRIQRGIQSPLITESPISGQRLKEPTCNIEIISNKNIFDNNGTNSTCLSDNISENLKENATLKSGAKNNNSKHFDEEKTLHDSGDNNMLYGFFIGLVIGALFGVFGTFLWFKRKSSLPKIISVVNGIYKSEKHEDDRLYLQDVTEYSEIPDSEQKSEFHQYLDSPKHVTRAKFHTSPSIVVHVDRCVHSFQSEIKDNKEHANDRGLVENPGLVPSRSSDDSDIRLEKECNVNNGIKNDVYLTPFNMIDVSKNPDICIEFPKDIGDVDISTNNEENKTTETHTEQTEYLNSNSTYFVLSADENKMSLVPELTSCKDESEKSELQNSGKNEASECNKVDGQDNERMYFELSKLPVVK